MRLITLLYLLTVHPLDTFHTCVYVRWIVPMMQTEQDKAMERLYNEGREP